MWRQETTEKHEKEEAPRTMHLMNLILAAMDLHLLHTIAHSASHIFHHHDLFELIADVKHVAHWLHLDSKHGYLAGLWGKLS
jgi:hypothetical protein